MKGLYVISQHDILSSPQKDDPILHQPRPDVVGPLSAMGLFDDGGNQIAQAISSLGRRRRGRIGADGALYEGHVEMQSPDAPIGPVVLKERRKDETGRSRA